MESTPQNNIQELVAELKTAYGRLDSDCGKGLLPPVTEQALQQLELDLKVPIPADLKALLLVHGGQEGIGPGITGLFGSHKLLSPSEIVDWYRMTLQVYNWHRSDPPDQFPPPPGEGGWWNPRLIPFATWDAYGLCIHADRGDVWDFEPYSGLRSHFPDIASTLRWLIGEVKVDHDIVLPLRKERYS